MARDIPGFYWDEAKRKYFRIQQSHHVAGGYGHTIQTVKAAEEVQRARERRETQNRKQRTGKIVRSPLSLRTNLVYWNKLGLNPRAHSNSIVNDYCTDLSRTRFIDSCLPPLSYAKELRGSTFAISKSGGLCAAIVDSRVDYRTSDSDSVTWGESVFRSQEISHDTCGFTLLPRYRSWVQQRSEILTIIHDQSYECGVLVCNGSRSMAVRSKESGGTGAAWSFRNRHSLLRNFGIETVWDVAAAPDRPVLAAATDSGLLRIEFTNAQEWNVMKKALLKKGEQMNVCYKDPNIVMSGERSGRINFTDIRMDENIDQSVVRLLHSSAVLATTSTSNSNQIIAHGFSTTSLYDLRYVKQTPVQKTARSRNRRQHSLPTLQFAVPRDRHTDHYCRGRKLAYSTDLNLVAAASCRSFIDLEGNSEKFGYVTLYSVSTGRVLPSPLTRHVYHDDLKSIDIRRVRDGPESIFVLSENNLDEWYPGGRYSDAYSEAEEALNEHEREKLKGVERDLTLSELSTEQEWERTNERLYQRGGLD